MEPRRRRQPSLIPHSRRTLTRLNLYGNLPRTGVKSLLARKDVFSGTVNGVGGIWQRPPRGLRRDGTYGTKGNTQRKVAGKRTGLTLLVAYEDDTKYSPRFGFQDRAVRVIRGGLAPAFREALRKALATAR